MNGTFSRKIIFLCLFAAGWVSLWCPPRALAADTRPTTTSAPTAVEETADSPPPTRLSDLLRGSKDSDGGSTPPAMWKMLAYMLVIVVLGVGAIVVVRKVLPRIGAAMPSGKRISTIETAHLGPRKTVHLLQVGTRKILVGGTREGLSMLADVTDAFDPAQGREGGSDAQ